MKKVSPIRILVQGDSHGNVADIIPKIYKAGEYRINHVLVVGDFGLWTHYADGQLFLDEVNEAARINNLTVFAIGGNHENWDHWNWMCENFPTAKGFAMARRRVLLAPKVHEWTWAGKRFAGAGGAVSVDRDVRLMSENNDMQLYSLYGIKPSGRGPRTEYWPNEQFEDAHVAEFKRRIDKGSVDYLFTHDCSNHTPWKQRLKDDPDSEIHRRRIDEVIAHAEPRFHFHGHMHEQYDWHNVQSLGYYDLKEAKSEGVVPVRTIGLEAFRDFNSWGVLDTEQDRWYWPREFYKAQEERAERKTKHDEQRGSGKDYVVTKSAV